MTEPHSEAPTRAPTRLMGAVLVVMGTFTVAQAVYFNRQDAKQSDCLVSVIHGLTGSLEARTATTPRDTILKKRATAAAQYESDASGNIWDTYVEAAGFLRENPTAEIPPKEQVRLQGELVKAILHYGVVSQRVEERRERLIKKNEELDELRSTTPIPPFPQGTCDEEG